MEIITFLIDFILHLDDHLEMLLAQYGNLVYLILFTIVFVETGLVVMPFLPGDSLLFAAGTFAALDHLNIYILIPMLIIAAVVGDSVNYYIGNFIGPKVFQREYRFIKREYLLRTEQFYERHGGKAIILARFIPIVRTFAPFVAGVASMNYARFLTYNIVGGVIWVVLFTLAGFFFGNIPIVKDNFTIVIMAIIFVSVLPPIWEYIRHKFLTKPQPPE